MDLLLKKTYVSILEKAGRLETLSKERRIYSRNLVCATKVMHRLIGILYKLNEENVVLLEKILPSHGENDEILEGWSEEVEASLVYSLRTSLAKTAKDTSISQHSFGKLKDVEKLKRHLRIVCDRLEKGHRFTDKPKFQTL